MLDDASSHASLRSDRDFCRSQEKLCDLQRQVAELEQKFDQLSLRRNVTNQRAHGIPDKGSDLKSQLLELSNVKAHLLTENTQLRQQFREASQRSALLSDMLKAEQKLYHIHESHFRLLKPLSHQSHQEIHLRAMDRMSAFEEVMTKSRAVGTVAGWKGRRFVDRGLFKFALEKKTAALNARVVWIRLWELMTDPARFRRTHPADMEMRSRLVQKVDDNTYIFLQETRSVDPADNGALVTSAVLMSRLRVGSRYRIYLHNLDRKQIEMTDKMSGAPVELNREIWMTRDQLVWIEYEDIGTGAHRGKFCGIIPTIGSHVYFWMAEIVKLTLRAQMEIFGPRFSLPST